MAAYPGLVPSEDSSEGSIIRGGITKAGNSHVRRLLVEAAQCYRVKKGNKIMELQTVIQVSKTFGISAQMLCYYERSGLIQSLRKEDYAYRVYDGENIKRLMQVVILRKLQIPVKQIKEILGNPNAVEVVEIFKENIEQLDVQITALSTLKSILVMAITAVIGNIWRHLLFIIGDYCHLHGRLYALIQPGEYGVYFDITTSDQTTDATLKLL